MAGAVSTRYFRALVLSWFILCGIAFAAPDVSPDYQWLNQTEGPRPEYVWENREDVIYHDLSYNDKAIETTPEIVPFMHRAWVFNKAMTWYREPEGILCYSAPATLLLTDEEGVSAWHSDPANELAAEGKYTIFRKRSVNRRRDCAVLPAFQFHVGQNPTVELDVAQATDDWQFVVSVKGRSGPPLLASDWKKGKGKVTFDLASALKVKGYDLNYAELHFVIGTWTGKSEDEALIRFRLRMPGRAALVPSLPVVRTAEQARKSGVPILAVALDEEGRRPGKDEIRVRASVDGRTIALKESDGIWRASVRDLEPGDYTARLRADGKLRDRATLYLRVTDGKFWQYEREHHLFSRGGQIAGPLSGSYQGNFFVREAGGPDESLVQGQDAWDRWDRSKPPGEHLHYWEALTAGEMEERFAYLESCGWDILHVCQHWGIWERLDAGGRIAPHGAEQIALYLRTAGRHGLAVIQALTHYEYSTRVNGWHGTIPFTDYLEAGFESDDFTRPGRNPKFEEMFHRYLKDYVKLFGSETALFAMTASGEGDATIGHARAHDTFDFVRSLDSAHMFLGEPTHILSRVPRRYTNGWRQDLFGGRTYAIAQNFMPEYDLGVEMKLYQLGNLAMAEGSWGASNLYAAFHHHALGDKGWPDESWIGSERYRIRLRDSLYLGLVHRLPKMVTWDEQIAEDEHRLIPVIRKHVDWTKPFQTPGVAVKLASDDISAEHRKVLVKYEKAFSHLDLSYLLLHHDDPTPSDVEVVFDASSPYIEPSFISDGGTVPDKLKGSRPLIVTGDYALNHTWSRDRSTLLAYVYNVAGHFESSLPLAGCFHRKPLPVGLIIQIQSLPTHALKLRLYDVNEQNVHTETEITGNTSLDIGRTSHDYFVLITPG